MLFWCQIVDLILDCSLFRLNLKGNCEVFSSGFCLDNECWRLYEQKVHDILSQGLGERAKSIRVIWRNISSGCRLEKVVS